jgi:hypothetical protein
MIYDRLGGVTLAEQDVFDRLFEADRRPRVIKPYLAECPYCNERFPYHAELFPTCGNPDCPRGLPASSGPEVPLLEPRPLGS